MLLPRRVLRRRWRRRNHGAQHWNNSHHRVCIIGVSQLPECGCCSRNIKKSVCVYVCVCVCVRVRLCDVRPFVQLVSPLVPSQIVSFCRFIVIILVYVVGGVLFLHFSKGASGVEMIPNVSFWKEVPGLVKVRKPN